MAQLEETVVGHVSILVLANASNLFDVSVKNTGEENRGGRQTTYQSKA